MNELLLKNYINKLTKDDIVSYLESEKINITKNDIDIIYDYIKKYFMIFYKGDPSYLFNELKEKLTKEAYNKALELYQKYKKD